MNNSTPVITHKTARVRVRPTYGYRYLRSEKYNEAYTYACQPDTSIGRAINCLIKTIKNLDKQQPKLKAYFISGVSNLCFKAKPELIIEKYKSRYGAGSVTKGPFTPRSPQGLFKKILRNALRYKTKDKKLYKKLCVLGPETQYTQEKGRRTN